MERKRYVIMMAAGSGTRMGAGMPKQFLDMDGKAVLQRTIEVFLEACPGISVVTVLPEDFIDYWKEYCLKHNFICPQILVKGGITRFHSVRNALARIPDGAIAAVHDGVRPLITSAKVRELFEFAEDKVGVVPVIPCVDTMKVLRLSELKDVWEAAGEEADRSVLFGAQTPQVFQSEILKEAYAQAYDPAFTDDASVVTRYGKSLSYVMGERLNIKITTPEDLIMAKAIVALRDM
jgi:2-C-methyl-D-erythritol 4-phosphate cytidylyltransferase